MCVGVGFALAYISLAKIDVSDWEVYVVVAHQFAFLGGLESTHLTGCLCDVVALSLEALLGIFSHCLVCLRNLAWSIIIYLPNFVVFFADVFPQFRELAEFVATLFTLVFLHFMLSTDKIPFVLVIYYFLVDCFNVSLQMMICTKFMPTFVTFILLDPFMNNLHMTSKVLFDTALVITLFTFNILNFFMDHFCVSTQNYLLTCSIVTHGALVISSFLMHSLNVLINMTLVF